MMRGKKGISPLLATVLLIGFTVALVGLLILWGRSYVEERAHKEGELAEKRAMCTNLKYSVIDSVAAVDAEGKPNSVTITIKNEGNTKIDGFMFRIEGDKGGPAFEHTKAIAALDQDSYVISSSTKKEEIGRVEDGTISLLPRIKVASGVYVTCSEKEKAARIRS
ncbi:MAG: archaellin/type IV pilin N-terminal domain-containing protein [Candidatus Woesearchaeota archaeon]